MTTAFSVQSKAALTEIVNEIMEANKNPGVQNKPDTLAPPAAPGWKALMHQSIDSFGEPLGKGQVLELQKDGSFKVLAGAAAMGQGGVLGVIEKPLNFWPALPVGSILVGGLVGMTVGGVIDSLVSPKDAAGKTNMMNVGIKAGALLVLGTQGHRLMGGMATVISVGVLGTQLLADLFPQIRQIVAWFVNLFKKVMPGMQQGQSAMHQTVTEVSPPAGFSNGLMSRNDLYAGIFGGA